VQFGKDNLTHPCHSEPALSARNLLAAGSETADSSRENTRFGMTIACGFQTALRPGLRIVLQNKKRLRKPQPLFEEDKN